MGHFFEAGTASSEHTSGIDRTTTTNQALSFLKHLYQSTASKPTLEVGNLDTPNHTDIDQTDFPITLQLVYRSISLHHPAPEPGSNPPTY